MKIRTFLILLPLALCGCQAIGNWFDSVGEHMPVIGDRCEHWQCFTSSGQQASDANKAKMQQQPAAASTSPASDRMPANVQPPEPSPAADRLPSGVPTTPAPQPATPSAPAAAMPQYENPPVH